jgi:alpha-galactosidase
MKSGEILKILGKLPWMPLDFGLSFTFLELYGVWSSSSPHITPYWEHERTLKERSKDPVWEDTIFGWTENRWNFVDEVINGKNYEEYPEEYCFNPFHARQAIGVLSSIEADEKREWGGILFRNRGIISNLPDGAVVEGHAIVDKKGITPINIGDLPKPFIGISRQVIEWQELSVDAALSGDKDILYQALLACPYVIDTVPAKKIMNKLLVAHSELMPQFE